MVKKKKNFFKFVLLKGRVCRGLKNGRVESMILFCLNKKRKQILNLEKLYDTEK